MYDRARYAVTETCLALTIFHEELSVKVFALFTALLFSKVFHWLCECRVDFIQQDDGAGPWAHLRLVALIGTLLASDVALLTGCAWVSAQNMPSVLILFGFEYAILAVAALATVSD
jgi:E3 ubiquitin-protein ligase synoviolin